ncbi:MAG: MBL fold metallo-hydrolase [Rhodobacteraceae bacterium]|nr:MBL fold metallo-hydrolase [Paracoccaceae bacterium]
MARRSRACSLLFPLLFACYAGSAAAQDRIPSHCVALAQGVPGAQVMHKAAFGQPVARDTVRISFVTHATFTLETPGGLTLATDYTGAMPRGAPPPDVVTMNNAHSSHWTALPDPQIPHVLHGWGLNGRPAEHHLDLGEVLVRNVTTDVRDGYTGVRKDGNSIFIFEVAGLCIGHLGHLHHEPDALQYGLIGRLDVVMVPVDGGYTMDLASMRRVVARLRSSVVLPMHWFSGASLTRFLDEMGGEFAIDQRAESDITLSLHTLPPRPTIIVLQPGLYR